MSSEKEYRNPADKKTYVSEGGWKTYKPEIPRQSQSGQKVVLGPIRLLTSEKDIEARMAGSDSQAKAVEMSAPITEAERLAKVTFAECKKPFHLLVQFNCTPTGNAIKTARQGDVSPELLQSYYTGLTGIKKLPVKTGEISFQFEVSVNP